MDTQGTPADVSYADGCQPLAVCMVCLTEFPPDVAECPKCHVALSLVRKCPGCSKIVSARHSKCIYCNHVFVIASPKPVEDEERGVRDLRRQQRMRRLVAAAVSLAVFTSVFTIGLIVSRRLEHRLEVPVLTRLATSYAVRPTAIYREASLSGAPIARLKATEVVEVLDFVRAGKTEGGWYIQWKGIEGYVRPRDFAPPKVVDPEKGYPLLRVTILGIEDPGRMSMAMDAVQYYREAFPTSPHRDELAWVAAEQAQEIARTTGDGELLRRAREAYTLLAAGGEYADRAHQAVENLPSPGQLSSGRKRPPNRSPGMEFVGSGTGGVSPQTAQKFTLLDQTEVWVELPPLEQVTAGAVLQGRMARELRARDHVAVPAGAPCALRVLESVPAASSSAGHVLVQMTGMQVSGRQVGVNTFPVRVSLPAAGNTSPQPTTLVIKLRTPLLIPEQ